MIEQTINPEEITNPSPSDAVKKMSTDYEYLSRRHLSPPPEVIADLVKFALSKTPPKLSIFGFVLWA